MTDTHELAWAAGFFDGEGCTSYVPATGNGLVVCITQKDRRVLDRFQEATGNWGKIYGPAKNPKQTPWQYRAAGLNGVRVYRQISPWLGEIKREQFKSRFKEWKRRRDKRFRANRSPLYANRWRHRSVQ